MEDTIYKPFGRVLMRDEDERPLAVSCKQCGRFALDTESGLCAGCNTSASISTTFRIMMNGYTAVVQKREAQ